MAHRLFEYRVAMMQLGKVTFVDGQWAGKLPPTDPKAIDGCEELSAWLRQAGLEGWELVSATAESVGGQIVHQLYLKRELAPRG